MWIRTLALAAGALLFAAALGGSLPIVAKALVVIGGLATLWTIGIVVAPRLRRDPYSLDELQRVHEREELRDLDDEGALGEPESVLCGRCLNEYPYRLGACPRCGQSR